MAQIETRERKEEKKGAAPWTGLSLGVRSAPQTPSGLGALAHWAQTWNPALLLGTKTGTLALVLACTSGAAGLSYILGNRGVSQDPMLRSNVFSVAAAGASAAAQALVSAGKAASSLDFLAQANGSGEAAGPVQEEALEPYAGASPEEAPKDAPPPSVASGSSARMDIPKLAASKGGASGSTGGTAASFPSSSSSEKSAGGPQGLLRSQPQGSSFAAVQARPSYGSVRRTGALGSFGGAKQQAVALNRLGQTSAGARVENAAATMTQGWDSGGAGAGASAIGASGIPLDLKNMGPGANGTSDVKNVANTPPSPGKGEAKKEKQNQMVMLALAMMAMMMLLMMMSKQSCSSGNCQKGQKEAQAGQAAGQAGARAAAQSGGFNSQGMGAIGAAR